MELHPANDCLSSPVIGVLGGGQLGLMLSEAAAPLGIQLAILDVEDAPAKRINRSRHHVAGSFKDGAKVRELAARCDFLTVETEHVDVDTLQAIATAGVPLSAVDRAFATTTTTKRKVAVHPSWKTLALIRDKYEQKQFLAAHGICVAAQCSLPVGPAMLDALPETSSRLGLPWMLKSRLDSFDGRGNVVISSAADYAAAARSFGSRPCYGEQWQPFVRELAVVVIRTEDAAGNPTRLLPYPAVETVHQDSVCARVLLPPPGLSAAVCRLAQQTACDVVAKLWGRGVFAVEMFVMPDEALVVNEIAPRVHNSGHLFTETIPYMSQFKAQLLAILDEPLPDELVPHVSCSMMINILGGVHAASHQPLLRQAKAMYGPKTAVYIHLYGKEARPGRKIGHITLTGLGSLAELQQFAEPLVAMAETMRCERRESRDSSESMMCRLAP